jgi:beta-glucosidase
LLLVASCAFLSPAPQDNRPETVIPVEDWAPTNAKSYDWLERHNAVVDRVKKGKVDLLLIGDSITHGWGGEPEAGGNRGPGSPLWSKYFAPRNAVNLGFGWDRTQHVLWRFEHGEIDGIRPKAAVIMIGTNNIGVNSTADIVTGVAAVVDSLHAKLPETKVLLLAIFPRGRNSDNRDRQLVAEVNREIAKLNTRPFVTYMDLTDKFIESDGTISSEMMPDALHPTLKGYTIWAEAMEPTLKKLMGEST